MVPKRNKAKRNKTKKIIVNTRDFIMALRHPFPETVLPDLRRGAEPENAPPLMRNPREVKFRPGGDIEKLSREMVGYTSVRVSATVGAGKSTRMPKELAKAKDLPVIHVVPSRLLAVHLYDYLSQADVENNYHLSLQPTDGFGEKGVTLTYSANMCAVMLQRSIDKSVKPFGDCILYLDECHESDAYTYTLGKLAHTISGVQCVLFASATHSPDRMPMREAEGELESRMFPQSDKPSTWDPLDSGKPWGVASFPGNALLYVDSEKVASELVAKYEQAGATAYRLSSKMSVSAFRDAMRALTDPNSGIVVLVADYSFRSGYTFDVQTIVDSCVVQYNVVDNGKFSIRCRFAYELERNQAAGRGGRTAGSSCISYAPDVKAEAAICMLEGVEMDAAAIMFRYLGYTPPVELRHTLMAKGNVPNDFARAANGVMPLPLLAEDELYGLVAPKRMSTPNMPEKSPSMSDVLDSYAVPTPPMSPKDFFVDAVDAELPVDQRQELNGLGFLHELQLMSGTGNTVVPGRYYMVPGIPNEEVETRLYGMDWKTAASEILGSKFLVHGFSRADRHEMVALLLAEYNKALTVKTGLEVMLQAKESLTTLASRYPKQVHDWTEIVGTVLREAESTVNMTAEALQKLRTDNMRFVPINANVDAEGMVAQQYAQKLHGAIQSIKGCVDPDKYLQFIQSRIDEGPSSVADNHETLEIDKGGRPEHALVRVRSAKVGRKRMIDITAHSGAGMVWDKRDFKVMLATYLENSGLTIHAVRSLTLLHTNVRGEEVIQEIRDDPKYLQREKTRFQLTYSDKGKGTKRLLRAS